MAIAQAISSAAFSKRLPASSLGVWQLLESDFRGRNDRDGVDSRRPSSSTGPHFNANPATASRPKLLAVAASWTSTKVLHYANGA
jgi:hypothetical protein